MRHSVHANLRPQRQRLPGKSTARRDSAHLASTPYGSTWAASQAVQPSLAVCVTAALSAMGAPDWAVCSLALVSLSSVLAWLHAWSTAPLARWPLPCAEGVAPHDAPTERAPLVSRAEYERRVREARASSEVTRA